jgi:threonine synthase
LSISMALSMGIETVVVSSTGNAGASLAAYAARAGLRAIIIVVNDTPPAKLVQMAIHGATIVTINGSLSDAYWLARSASDKWKWMNLTSTFLSTFGVEGDKTVAYEIFQQFERVPDWIIIPVSVGPLLVGVYKGFQDLLKLNQIDKLPRLVAAQASKCAPIESAFKNKEDKVRAWEGPVNSVAGGVADPLIGYENEGTYALRIIRRAKGMATKSTDEEILQATQLLAQTEGIFSEPTGAVSLAALKTLKLNQFFSPNQSVVCLITGHGLKHSSVFEHQVNNQKSIEPTLESLALHLKSNL